MATASTKNPGTSTNRRRAKASETPRPSVSFRLRADVYERIKASAEARGFSLSEEIEHRLNRSLDTAGDHFAELALQLIADNWRAVQSLSGRKMVEDKFTLQACCEAAYRATELLAGVNGMDLHLGTFDSLGPEGTNVEAGKQLGQAIVYHRELLHMKDPPQWATSVYEANVIDALTKRVTALQAKEAERAVAAVAPAPPEVEQPVPVPEAALAQTEEPATCLVGPEEAAALMAGTKPARGQDAGIFDRALFAETMGPERSDGGDAAPPVPAEEPAPKPRTKAKATT